VASRSCGNYVDETLTWPVAEAGNPNIIGSFWLRVSGLDNRLVQMVDVDFLAQRFGPTPEWERWREGAEGPSID
jgi:hypothetical protein